MQLEEDQAEGMISLSLSERLETNRRVHLKYDLNSYSSNMNWS